MAPARSKSAKPPTRTKRGKQPQRPQRVILRASDIARDSHDLRLLYYATVVAKHSVRALIQEAAAREKKRGEGDVANANANANGNGNENTATDDASFVLRVLAMQQHLRDLAIRLHSLEAHYRAVYEALMRGDVMPHGDEDGDDDGEHTIMSAAQKRAVIKAVSRHGERHGRGAAAAAAAAAVVRAQRLQAAMELRVGCSLARQLDRYVLRDADGRRVGAVLLRAGVVASESEKNKNKNNKNWRDKVVEFTAVKHAHAALRYDRKFWKDGLVLARQQAAAAEGGGDGDGDGDNMADPSPCVTSEDEAEDMLEQSIEEGKRKKGGAKEGAGSSAAAAATKQRSWSKRTADRVVTGTGADVGHGRIAAIPPRKPFDFDAMEATLKAWREQEKQQEEEEEEDTLEQFRAAAKARRQDRRQAAARQQEQEHQPKRKTGRAEGGEVARLEAALAQAKSEMARTSQALSADNNSNNSNDDDSLSAGEARIVGRKTMRGQDAAGGLPTPGVTPARAAALGGKPDPNEVTKFEDLRTHYLEPLLSFQPADGSRDWTAASAAAYVGLVADARSAIVSLLSTGDNGREQEQLRQYIDEWKDTHWSEAEDLDERLLAEADWKNAVGRLTPVAGGASSRAGKAKSRQTAVEEIVGGIWRLLGVWSQYGAARGVQRWGAMATQGYNKEGVNGGHLVV